MHFIILQQLVLCAPPFRTLVGERGVALSGKTIMYFLN
jgi:hypothetical protein